MDSVKRDAGLDGICVARSKLEQLEICSDYGALAAAINGRGDQWAHRDAPVADPAILNGGGRRPVCADPASHWTLSPCRGAGRETAPGTMQEVTIQSLNLGCLRWADIRYGKRFQIILSRLQPLTVDD